MAIGAFKVTYLGTDRNHVCECDFLLVANTNVHRILHHFQVIAALLHCTANNHIKLKSQRLKKIIQKLELQSLKEAHVPATSASDSAMSCKSLHPFIFDAMF